MRTAVHRKWHSHLYILGDMGCTAVRVNSSRLYTCAKGVIPHTAACCTAVRIEWYNIYVCTDEVVLSVRVYMS
jgi:hypothetical protein